MEELKKNAYWVVLGVLALVAGGFWMATVALGKNAEIKKQTAKLKSQVKELEAFSKIREDEVGHPEKGLPVEEIVKYWQARRQKLEEESKEVAKKYQDRDAAFERLFNANQKNEVAFTSWVTEFRARMKSDLRAPFKDLLETDDDATFARAFPIKEPAETDEPAKWTIAQKQLYIARAVAEALKQSTKGAILEELGFVTKDKEPGQKATEKLERIDVSASTRMPFSAVPTFVSKLLRASGNGVLFDVREVKVEAAPFSVAEFEPWKVFEEKPAGGPIPGAPGGGADTRGMRAFGKDVYVATVDTSNPKTKSGPPELAEPLVSVKVTLHAMDFNLNAAVPAKKGGKAENGGGGEGGSDEPPAGGARRKAGKPADEE